jgi:2-keto-4-pentenoate hydratase/2-oxohepta-3-ene-1,7-dioic acid hydratase in catechol pathway
LHPDSATVSQTVLTVKTLLSPLTREQVGLVRCLGLNYADHAAEANLAKPAFPVLFYKPSTSLIAPNAPIIIPSIAQPVKNNLPDYEVELVIVIGRPAKNVSQRDALDYVLAYTGANDVRSRKCVEYNSQQSN